MGYFLIQRLISVNVFFYSVINIHLLPHFFVFTGLNIVVGHVLIAWFTARIITEYH